MKMHQYGSEFLVKYQFNILSNALRITLISQNRHKGTNISAKKQIKSELFSNTRGRFFLFDPLRRQRNQSNKKEPSPTVCENFMIHFSRPYNGKKTLAFSPL